MEGPKPDVKHVLEALDIYWADPALLAAINIRNISKAELNWDHFANDGTGWPKCGCHPFALKAECRSAISLTFLYTFNGIGVVIRYTQVHKQRWGPSPRHPT